MKKAKHFGCCIHGISYTTDCSHCEREASGRRLPGYQSYDGRRDPSPGIHARLPKPPRVAVHVRTFDAVLAWHDFRTRNRSGMRVWNFSQPISGAADLEAAKRYWVVLQVEEAIADRARSSPLYHAVLCELVTAVATHANKAAQHYRGTPATAQGIRQVEYEIDAILRAIEKRLNQSASFLSISASIIE